MLGHATIYHPEDGEADQAIALQEQALALAEKLDLPGEQRRILVSLSAAYQARREFEQAQAAQARVVAIEQRLAASFEGDAERAAFLASARAAVVVA